MKKVSKEGKTQMKNKAFDHSKYQEWIDPNKVKPYERNAKKHDEKQINNIATSIRRFGWQQDTVLTADNVVIIGHGRRLAAIQLGCEMPFHRIDKTADEVTDEDIRELRIADNETNAETGFDFDILAEEINDLDFDGFDFDFGIGSEPNEREEAESKYSKATNIPQYEPTGESVTFEAMVNTAKSKMMIEEIEDDTDITEDEKEFLKLAAARHNVFNYKKIAEYYANASEAMQRYMEESALVIIDVDNAIANGYARLNREIEEMIEE